MPRVVVHNGEEYEEVELRVVRAVDPGPSLGELDPEALARVRALVDDYIRRLLNREVSRVQLRRL